MRIYVGTSGWRYDWNPDGLRWYVQYSEFNAVELNMSFYSFPREKQVDRWFNEGRKLRWSIKVHRSITHLRRMNEKSIPTWKKFRERFKPMEELIDFYLFQLPPSVTYSKAMHERILKYSEMCGKIAIEPRNKSWFNRDVIDALSDLNIVIVTPDSPMYEGLPETGVISINDIVYVRMHGRLAWYNYGYLDEELEEVAEKILEKRPEKIYVFFNNNHDMLGDGRRMLEILRKKVRRAT